MAALRRKSGSAVADLRDLDAQRERVIGRARALYAEKAALAGASVATGRTMSVRRGGTIAEVSRAMTAERQRALREGSDPNLDELEATLAVHRRREADIDEEIALAQNTVQAIATDRENLLAERHREFVEDARSIADDGKRLLAALEAAQAAVEKHRVTVVDAVTIAAAGKPRGERAAVIHGFRPWTDPLLTPQDIARGGPLHRYETPTKGVPNSTHQRLPDAGEPFLEVI